MEELIENAMYQKFLEPLEMGIKIGLKDLSRTQVKHEETKSLLKQVSNTLKNSKKLLNENKFIDSNSLLRCSIEYLAMGMLIEEDENVYKEFIDLSLTERKHTKPLQLVKRFGRRTKEYCKTLFTDTNLKEREILFEGLYDTLCSYTHSSLLIYLFDKVKDKKEKNVLRMLMNLNLYFVKLVYYFCLKHITKNEYEVIEVGSIFFSFMCYSLEINNYISKNEISFAKYNKYLHVCNNNIDLISEQQKQLKKINDDFSEKEFTREERQMLEEELKKYLK